MATDECLLGCKAHVCLMLTAEATSTEVGRFVTPKLREWEARWLRSMRENDRLKARVGSLLREVSRLTDRA